MNLLHETFPAIECLDNEQLQIMNPKTVANTHTLIDCISITLEDSINARALEHESAMVDAYTK